MSFISFLYSEKDHFAVKSKPHLNKLTPALNSEKDHFAVKSKRRERECKFRLYSEKDHFAVKSKPVTGDFKGDKDSEKDHFAVKSKLVLSNYFLHYQYISLFSYIKRLIYFAHFSSLCNLCHKEARRLTQLARNRHYARAHQ